MEKNKEVEEFMVGKNNNHLRQEKMGNKIYKYAIKRLSVGVASVAVAAGLVFTSQTGMVSAAAESVEATPTEVSSSQEEEAALTESKVADQQDQPLESSDSSVQDRQSSQDESATSSPELEDKASADVK